MGDEQVHPLQRLVDTIGKAGHDTRSNYHLTLGQMVDQLATVPSDLPVTFDFNGIAPDVFDSYRGYYDDLALDYDERQSKTVEILWRLCRAALGSTFEGYKGGDYVMDKDTPLWAAHYGQSSGRAIMGLSILPDRVVILTKEIGG